MAKYALPCIACGQELENVDISSTNQPYNGTAFITHGHYGSTAYDPMDGHYIEVNICDACLILHKDRVLEGRDRRPVMETTYLKGDLNEAEPCSPEEADWHIPSIVGWEDTMERLVPWNPKRNDINHVLKVTVKERNLVSIDELTDEEFNE